MCVCVCVCLVDECASVSCVCACACVCVCLVFMCACIWYVKVFLLLGIFTLPLLPHPLLHHALTRSVHSPSHAFVSPSRERPRAPLLPAAALAPPCCHFPTPLWERCQALPWTCPALRTKDAAWATGRREEGTGNGCGLGAQGERSERALQPSSSSRLAADLIWSNGFWYTRVHVYTTIIYHNYCQHTMSL